MKVIKLDGSVVTNIRHIGSYVKVVNDDYVMNGTETLVTDIIYIEELNRQNIIDYVKKRMVYKYLSSDFSNLSPELKERIVVNHATDMMTMFVYYMTKGLTEQQAQIEIMRTKSSQILQSTKCHKNYLESEKFFMTMMMFMKPLDVEKFTNDSLTLFELYERIALYGKKYGDNTVGIMDFIESHDVYAGHGLLDYELNDGMDVNSLIYTLKDILMNGNLD